MSKQIRLSFTHAIQGTREFSMFDEGRATAPRMHDEICTFMFATRHTRVFSMFGQGREPRRVMHHNIMFAIICMPWKPMAHVATAFEKRTSIRYVTVI